MNPQPPRTETLTIGGPAGKLEALLEAPPVPSPLQPSDFAVICHPHPLHGGSMQNKVVYTIASACQERSMPTLRFNFRGVGASAGSYDEGRGEIQDTLAVVAFGRARWPDAALTLAGFSFGAVVSLMAAAAAAPSRLISVAPAVGGYGAGSIARPACPWLIVQGDADEVVERARGAGVCRKLQPAAAAGAAAGRGAFLSPPAGSVARRRNRVSGRSVD